MPPDPQSPEVGDSVIFGFGPQAFVTRAHVAGVSGLASGRPVVEGVCDASGMRSLSQRSEIETSSFPVP
jgi:hypothetical protein